MSCGKWMDRLPLCLIESAVGHVANFALSNQTQPRFVFFWVAAVVIICTNKLRLSCILNILPEPCLVKRQILLAPQ